MAETGPMRRLMHTRLLRLTTLLALTCLAWSAAWGVSLHVGTGRALLAVSGGSSSNVPPCSQTTAYYARLSTMPTQASQNLINQAICLRLVPSGVFDAADAIYVLAQDTQANALIDLTANAHNLTQTGIESFAPNIGFFGDSLTGYFDTGFSPSTAAHYAQNSATLATLVQNNRPGLIDAAGVGACCTAANASFNYIMPRFTSGQPLASLNETATNMTVAYAGSTAGAWVASRTSNVAECLYHDNTALICPSTNTSVGVATHTFLVGARHNSSANAVASKDNDTIGFVYIGAGLNSSQVASLTTAMKLFQYSGAVPIPVVAWGLSSAFNWTASGAGDIDTANTLAAGFTFYVSSFVGNVVPSASDFTYSSGKWVIGASTLASNYRARIATAGNTSSEFTGTIDNGSGTGSPSGNVLTVTATHAGNPPLAVGQKIALGGAGTLTANSTITARGTGTGGTGTYTLSQSSAVASVTMVGQSYIGQVFNPGGYWEACYSWIPANTPSSSAYVGGYIAWWTQDIAGLLAQNFTSAYSTAANFAELDHYEAIPTITAGAPNNAMNAHDWTLAAGGTLGSNNSSSNIQPLNPILGNPDFTQKHCVETLWVPSTKNGGIGFTQRFFDNQPVWGMGFQYSSGAIASPGFGPSNPIGTWFDSESGKFPLILEGAYNTNTMTLYSAQLYQ